MQTAIISCNIYISVLGVLKMTDEKFKSAEDHSKFFACKTGLTLNEIIHSIDGYYAVMNYLNSEFSIENLLFMTEYIQWRNSVQIHLVKEALKQLNVELKQAYGVDENVENPMKINFQILSNINYPLQPLKSQQESNTPLPMNTCISAGIIHPMMQHWIEKFQFKWKLKLPKEIPKSRIVSHFNSHFIRTVEEQSLHSDIYQSAVSLHKRVGSLRKLMVTQLGKIALDIKAHSKRGSMDILPPSAIIMNDSVNVRPVQTICETIQKANTTSTVDTSFDESKSVVGRENSDEILEDALPMEEVVSVTENEDRSFKEFDTKSETEVTQEKKYDGDNDEIKCEKHVIFLNCSRQLFEKYIQAYKAPLEVNISRFTRKELSDIFAKTNDSICDMMKKDKRSNTDLRVDSVTSDENVNMENNVCDEQLLELMSVVISLFERAAQEVYSLIKDSLIRFNVTKIAIELRQRKMSEAEQNAVKFKIPPSKV